MTFWLVLFVSQAVFSSPLPKMMDLGDDVFMELNEVNLDDIDQDNKIFDDDNSIITQENEAIKKMEEHEIEDLPINKMFSKKEEKSTEKPTKEEVDIKVKDGEVEVDVKEVEKETKTTTDKADSDKTEDEDKVVIFPNPIGSIFSRLFDIVRGHMKDFMNRSMLLAMNLGNGIGNSTVSFVKRITVVKPGFTAHFAKFWTPPKQ